MKLSKTIPFILAFILLPISLALGMILTKERSPENIIGYLFMSASLPIVTLEKDNRIVKLYGVSHIAENSYYDSIHKELAEDIEQNAVILREGAGGRGTETKCQTPTFNLASNSEKSEIVLQPKHLGGCPDPFVVFADASKEELDNGVKTHLMDLNYSKEEALLIMQLISDYEGRFLFTPSTTTKGQLVWEHRNLLNEDNRNISDKAKIDEILKTILASEPNQQLLLDLKNEVYDSTIVLDLRNNIAIKIIMETANSSDRTSVVYGASHIPFFQQALIDDGWSVQEIQKVTSLH